MEGKWLAKKLNMLHTVEMLKSWQSILLSRPLNSYYNEIKVQTSAFMSHTRFNYFVQIED